MLAPYGHQERYVKEISTPRISYKGSKLADVYGCTVILVLFSLFDVRCVGSICCVHGIERPLR